MQKLLATSDFIADRTYEPADFSVVLATHGIATTCGYRIPSKSKIIDFYFSLAEDDQVPMPHTKYMSLIISDSPNNRYRLIVHFGNVRAYGISKGETSYIINTLLNHYSIPNYCYTLSLTESLSRLDFKYNDSVVTLKPFNVQVSRGAKYKLKNNNFVLSEIKSLVSNCKKCRKSDKSNIGVTINFRTRSVRYHTRDTSVHVSDSVYLLSYNIVYFYSKGEIRVDYITRRHTDYPYVKHVGSYNNFLYELATILDNLR